MKLVSIREAMAYLSKLVAYAARGEPFVVSKAGKPLVKVVALNAPSIGKRDRLGFTPGQMKVPDDLDRMGKAEIGQLFSTTRLNFSFGVPLVRERASQR